MVSDNDQCPIYKTRKKTHLLCKSFKHNISFMAFKKLYENKVDRMGWPFYGLTDWVDLFFWPKMLTFFWVDRTGWTFFGLTEQVELFIGWHFYGLTERVDLFCVGKIGLTFFWVDYENYSTVIYLLNLIPSLQYHATPQGYLRVVYWAAKSLWHFLINLKKFIISFPTVCSNF